MAHLLADLNGSDNALSDETSSRSWSELNARVNQWIAMLRGSGLSTGDTLAIVAGNGCATFEALLACLHAGIVVVPVNGQLTAREIAYLLRDSGSRAVLVDRRTAGAVGSAGGTGLVFGAESWPGFAAVEPLLDKADPGEPAGQCCGGLMLYTSGTTGEPKGVRSNLFPAGEPIARAERAAAYARLALGVPAHLTALLVGPWYHAAQLFFALLPLLRGCRLVMRERFDPAETLHLIDAEAVAVCHLVPTQLIRLLRLPPAARAGFRGTSLRLVWHGGGPCPVDVKRQMIAWWGPVLWEYYGATEGGVATVIDSHEWLARPGSVGRPVPPNRVVVVGQDGETLPERTIGRVFLRRPGPGFAYHNDVDKTRAAYLTPGVFTYGELGYTDEEGYLYLTGRASQTIVTGGVNVYPAEVEAVLLSHRSVRDAVVVGLPDDEYGERVLAVVELEPGDLSPDEAPAALERHCRTGLAGFKVPRAWRFTDQLPRDAAGKVRRQSLLPQTGEAR